MFKDTNTARRSFLKKAGAIGAAGYTTTLAGCLGDDDDDDADPADDDDADDTDDADDDDEMTTVTVTFAPRGIFNTATDIFGQHNGFFEEEGINIEFVSSGGGADSIRTIQAGDAQFSTVGAFSAMSAFEEGIDLTVIESEIKIGSDLFYYADADSGIETIDDAHGTTMGYQTVGDSTHMPLPWAVEEYELEDVELVSTGGIPDTFVEVTEGDVDIGWSVPPFFQEEVEAGEINIVFRGDVPPFDNLSKLLHVGDGEWIRNNPEATESYLTAYLRSTYWALENLEEASEIIRDQFHEDMDVDVVKAGFEQGYSKEGFEPEPIAAWDTINEMAVDFDFIEEPFTDEEKDEFIDLSFIPPEEEYRSD